MSFEPLTDEHEPASPEVFLDTTIHCSLHKGRHFKEHIDRVLKLFRWISTSTYTKVEYGNVVLAPAEYFLREIQARGSLADTLDWIGNVLSDRRHSAKRTWAFNLLVNHAGMDDAERTERAVLTLKRLMKLGVQFVDTHCHEPLEDGTQCYWARKGVRKKANGQLVWDSPKCSRKMKRCAIDEFFTEHRDIFERIKTRIDALPASEQTGQLRDFSQVIGVAIVDPTTLLDYKNGCRRLADAIIAADSRGYRNMFSQNKAESIVLTEVLGQDFYYLPSNHEKGVLLKKRSRDEE